MMGPRSQPGEYRRSALFLYNVFTIIAAQKRSLPRRGRVSGKRSFAINARNQPVDDAAKIIALVLVLVFGIVTICCCYRGFE